MATIRKVIRSQRNSRKRVEHAWMKDKVCAKMVRAAWGKLTESNAGLGVPSYLLGVAKAQERFYPNQAKGLRVLVKHAQEIVSGQRKPYQLPNR